MVLQYMNERASAGVPEIRERRVAGQRGYLGRVGVGGLAQETPGVGRWARQSLVGVWRSPRGAVGGRSRKRGKLARRLGALLADSEG